MPVAISIQWKPLRDSHYVVASLQPGGGGYRQLFAAQSVLHQLQALARRDPDRPIVGLLLGEQLECSLTRTPYVLIRSHVEVALASFDERTVSEAIRSLRGHVGPRDQVEAIGWFSSRSNEAIVSRVHGDVHADAFPEQWHPVLTLAAGGHAGAFFLYDRSASRWFQSPFYEVMDGKPGAVRAPKPTAIAWPAYLTTAMVVPLGQAEQSAPVAIVEAPVLAPPQPPRAIASPAPEHRSASGNGTNGSSRPETARWSPLGFAKMLTDRVLGASRQSSEGVVRLRKDNDEVAAPRSAEAAAARAQEDQRRAREEAERRAAREEAQRKAAEAARQRAAEAEARRAAEAKAQREAAEEVERRRAAEAEARRQIAESKRQAAEAEAQRKAAEAEARRAEQAEAQRKAAAEAEARRAEQAEAQRKAAAEAEARRAAQLEAQRKAAEEAERRRAAEAEAKRQAEAAEAQRKAAEAEARRKAAEAEAEARRQAAEAEAKRQALEAEARRAAEAEAQRKAAEEAERRRVAEVEARRKAAEEMERRRAAEIEAQRKAAEEAELRRVAEAEAKRRAEELEARRQAAEAEARRVAQAEAQRKADEEAKRRAAEIEAQRKAAEEARRAAAEAEARRAAEAEARRQAAEAEAKRVAAEAEARRVAAAEEEARRQAEEAEAEAQRKAAEAAAEEQRKAAEAEIEVRRKAAEAEVIALRQRAIADAEERRKAAAAEEAARRRTAESDALRISVEVAKLRERLASAPIEGPRRDTSRVTASQLADLEDTSATDGPYRYLALARREGFEVSERIERGTYDHPETVWLLIDRESGLRLIVVTTDDEVREASLHYNMHTEDESLLRVTAPEHRDLESGTIYGREACLHDLRGRCRRLRTSGALLREWKVSPTFQTPAAPHPAPEIAVPSPTPPLGDQLRG